LSSNEYSRAQSERKFPQNAKESLIDIEGRLSTPKARIAAPVIPTEDGMQIAHECCQHLCDCANGGVITKIDAYVPMRQLQFAFRVEFQLA
jgi:hypothetical protein